MLSEKFIVHFIENVVQIITFYRLQADIKLDYTHIIAGLYSLLFSSDLIFH
ncbi:hypothetical protein SPPR111872_14995 [Sphingobacterium prati]